MAWRWIDGFKARPWLILECHSVFDGFILFSQKVSKISNGIFGIANELCLGLRPLKFFSCNVG